MPSNPTRVPSYRKRSGYDRAIVSLTDAVTKRRRDYWLGEFGSPASRERYHRLIAEWEAHGRRLPEPEEGDANGARGATVDDVIERFWRWAGMHYAGRERDTFRPVLRLLRRMDGATPAAAYGPRRLRLIREAMIRGNAEADPPREPWSRPYINAQVKRIRRLFKWAASHELVPAGVHQALATVEPLRRGRTSARETEKVGPADMAIVEGAKEYMSRQVRALVDLQLLTGARPGELVSMCVADLDTGGPGGVWVYRPACHKNAHHGRERAIYLGPKSQGVIRPFVAGRAAEAPLFSPAEADAERRAARAAARKTPLSCGNRPGTNRCAAPLRRPGDRYTPESYYRAIRYACDKAFPPPPPLGRLDSETEARWRERLTGEQRVELKAWRAAHRFHPYQLRHTAATEIRRAFGLEAAQLVLGHASAAITDAVYAERDQKKVAEIMRCVG